MQENVSGSIEHKTHYSFIISQAAASPINFYKLFIFCNLIKNLLTFLKASRKKEREKEWLDVWDSRRVKRAVFPDARRKIKFIDSEKRLKAKYKLLPVAPVVLARGRKIAFERLSCSCSKIRHKSYLESNIEMLERRKGNLCSPSRSCSSLFQEGQICALRFDLKRHLSFKYIYNERHWCKPTVKKYR